MAKALDAGNINICDEISIDSQNGNKTKSMCQSFFTGDESLCVDFGEFRENCTKFIKSARTIMNKVDEVQKMCTSLKFGVDFEFFCRALLLGEYEKCTELKKADCYTVYYIAKAIFKKNPSFCDKIYINTNEVGFCKEQVTRLAS